MSDNIFVKAKDLTQTQLIALTVHSTIDYLKYNIPGTT